MKVIISIFFCFGPAPFGYFSFQFPDLSFVFTHFRDIDKPLNKC